MSKIISVDSGRSSTKYCLYQPKEKGRNKFKVGIFSSKHGVLDFNYIKTLPILNFNPKEDMIVKIDNDEKYYAVGETAELLLPPKSIMYSTNDETYIENSILYIFVAIARVCNNNDEIILPLNFTFNNFKFKDEIRGKIEGEHTVTFYDPKGNVLSKKKFRVIKDIILYQGWSSLVHKTINDDFTENSLYMKEGLVIDVGRKTVDVSFNRQLVPVIGFSYNLGMEYVYEYIRKRIFNSFGVKKETFEIEKFLMENITFCTRKGEEVNVRNYIEDAILYIAEKINVSILEDFEDYTYQFIIATGGGLIWFKDVFANIFPKIEFIDQEDIQYSNAIGMVKLAVLSMEEK